MTEFQRLIDLSDIQYKSLFLFGPRQTGKSYWLRKQFPNALMYNLLRSDLFAKISKEPHILREELLALSEKPLVIIDEIQRIPKLLNEVHLLIEEHDFKFILTGSSSRKLKRGGANLLAGRALQKRLFPLVSKELINFDLNKIINFGSLPAIYNSEIPEKELLSYVGTYLREEIQAEGLVRRLEPFSEFLDIAGLSNTEVVNYTNIASDLGVSAKTVKEYYLILQDTMMGELLPPYSKTTKRKAIATPKFFFFDVGVANILGKRQNVVPKTDVFGKCFEHFIYTELRAFLSYTNDRRELTFWRSRHGQEVDFIIGDDVAIEVKATAVAKPKHLRQIKKLSEEIEFKHRIIVSLDESPRMMEENFLVLPYKEFLKRLWNKEF